MEGAHWRLPPLGKSVRAGEEEEEEEKEEEEEYGTLMVSACLSAHPVHCQ